MAFRGERGVPSLAVPGVAVIVNPVAAAGIEKTT
jgi:hypothetical protein